ncbi:MAG: hypothetical protein E7085_05615 [Parabacteroides distasonis]|nr:hypothetical protein [Parabacteroides distasonis]
MRDLILTVKRQKIEIKIWGVCLLLAFLMNIVSIIIYETSWSELWTQFLWMLVLSCVFYGLTVLFRLLYKGICLLLKK